MQISGFQPITLLDFPDHLACIIFTPGCNFRCHYCHNPEFVLPEQVKNVDLADSEFVLDFLENRKGKLEGVVITGGEPTLQDGLIDFIKTIKNKGFKVKLDTNGSDSEKVSYLYKNKLIDYIAMDIKAPFEKYPEVSNFENTEEIKKTIKLILNSEIDYEFRSTVLPELHSPEDVEKMAKQIEGAKKYYLQNFRPGKTLNEKFATVRAFTEDEMIELLNRASKHVQRCEIRS